MSARAPRRAWIGGAGLWLACAGQMGCSNEPFEATWMTGFDWSWANTNHRLSALVVSPQAGGARVAVVGGSSTTAKVFDDGCLDPQTCGELPVKDSSDFKVTWTEAVTTSAQIVRDTARFAATLTGGEATITVPLRKRIPENQPVTAWIAGFSVATGDVPTDPALSCYDSRHGWLPRELALEVVDVARAPDGRSVDVGVAAQFEAGVTLEAIRRCLDAAIASAGISVELEVVVVAGAEAEDTAVTRSETVPFDASIDQDWTEDDRVDGPSDLASPYGWSSIGWRFHTDDPQFRGAYLRRMTLLADEGGAIGWATNEAPEVVLQSGFSFLFEGVLRAVDVDAELNHYEASVTGMPAEVDDAGRATVTTISYDPG